MGAPSRSCPIDPDAPGDPVGRPSRALQGPPPTDRGSPRVLRQVPGASLRIVGVGEYEDELRRMAAASPPEVTGKIEIGSIDPIDRDGMSRAIAGASARRAAERVRGQSGCRHGSAGARRRVLVADTSGLSEIARAGMATAVPIDATTEQIARPSSISSARPNPRNLRLPTWDEVGRAASPTSTARSSMPRADARAHAHRALPAVHRWLGGVRAQPRAWPRRARPRGQRGHDRRRQQAVDRRTRTASRVHRVRSARPGDCRAR